MYVVTSTVRNVDHLTIEEAKEICLKARGEGKRSEIMSEEEARRKGFLDPMQDLTKIHDWHFVK